MTERSISPSIREAFWVWARIAALSFGGPAGQIAVMHRILVEEKKWIGDERFLHALNYCMLLPGPEAQQLAVYIGWLLHRTRGGLIAGCLFILPGFIAILGLSYLYVLISEAPLIAGIFFGLKAAVLAVVLQAVVRVGSRTLAHPLLLGIAAAAFVAIFAFGAPFPLVVMVAALVGFAGGRTWPEAFKARASHGTSGAFLVPDRDTVLGDELPHHARPNPRWALRVAGVLLVLWLAPTAMLFVSLGPEHVFTRIAIFFSQTAVVTFGGAYAVLAYVAQEAVGTYGWVTPGEMLDGLGMAETTPGPLIMVTQFVGFIGAFRDPGALSPLMAAALAAVLTTWVTFVPSFLWIFLGAPYAERLRGNRTLSSALTAVTAAVVGVILNLGLWFGMHLLFRDLDRISIFGHAMTVPAWPSLHWPALAIVAAAMIALFRLRAGVLPVLAAGALIGGALRLIGLA